MGMALIMALNIMLTIPSVLAIPYFITWGEAMLGVDRTSFSPLLLRDRLYADVGAAARLYGHAIMYGFVAWGILSVIVVIAARALLPQPIAWMLAKYGGHANAVPDGGKGSGS